MPSLRGYEAIQRVRSTTLDCFRRDCFSALTAHRDREHVRKDYSFHLILHPRLGVCFSDIGLSERMQSRALRIESPLTVI